MNRVLCHRLMKLWVVVGMVAWTACGAQAEPPDCRFDEVEGDGRGAEDHGHRTPSPATEEAPRKLLLSLQGSSLPRTWPDLRVWLRNIDTSEWKEVWVRSPGISARQRVWLELPKTLRGKPLEAQVLVAHGESSVVLPMLGLDGEEQFRVEIPPAEPETAIQLVWRPLPTHRLEVKVHDGSNRPIEGAVLATWLFRDRRLIETSTLISDRQGVGILELEQTGDSLQIVCTKPGYAAGRGFISFKNGSPSTADCLVRPQEPPRDEPAPVIGGRIVDPQNKVPIEGAEVRLTWSRSAPPVRTASREGGFWWMPVPGPLPPRVSVQVDAPCYRSFTSDVEPSALRTIPLDLLCREVSLSFQVVEAGTGGLIQQPRRATARIRQGGKVFADGIRFDESGFSDSQAATVAIDPDRGPIEIEVQAPGYAPFVHRVQPADLINDTGFAPDLALRLRPAGSGSAVLINAAESWNDYPRVLAGTVNALARRGREKGFAEYLLLGSFQQPRLWTEPETSSAAGVQDALTWLAGLGAAGSQLTPDRLATELSGLSSHWPRAGDWDLVVILPHVAWASKKPLSDRALQDLVRQLDEGKVTIHILEVGGSLEALRALADSLGGRYTTVETPQEVEAALGKTLRQALEQDVGQNVGQKGALK